MNFSLSKLYDWYGKKTVIVAVVVIGVLIIVGLLLGKDKPTEETSTEALLPTVLVAPAATLSSEASVSLIGTVEAVNQSVLEAEASGRITRVNVEIGDTVVANQIIAQLENATEQAAVLQAEGSYEAALAAAASSDVGIDQAEISLQTANNNLLAAEDAITNLYRTSFTTNNELILQDIDDFFINPIRLEPRLRINGRTNHDFLEEERKSFRDMLTTWQNSTVAISEPEAALDQIEENTLRVLAMLDIFIELLPRAEEEAGFTEAELDAALVNFNTRRSQLTAILFSVDQNRTALMNAEEAVATAESAVAQAEIGGTSNELSAANAQVKQALGSLRNAQANLAKTIIRTPIAGEVNTIAINVGDFVSQQELIARVANNNALEITTFVGESDRDRIQEGQAVILEGQYDGVITAIAPAVDPEVRKIEVKIATESEALSNGDTVTIESISEGGVIPETLFIPITAVKFTNADGFIFTVQDQKLVSQPVEIGAISGSQVEIISGLSAQDEIVIDARGLVEAQEVETLTQ